MIPRFVSLLRVFGVCSLENLRHCVAGDEHGGLQEQGEGSVGGAHLQGSETTAIILSMGFIVQAIVRPASSPGKWYAPEIKPEILRWL